MHQRWIERHPNTSVQPAPDTAISLSKDSSGNVFVSYAKEDLAAVEQIKNALEQAGIEVFLDRSRLQPGEDWDLKLRRSIQRSSLFLAIVSRSALSAEGRRYVREEWRDALEEQRKISFAPEDAFIVPVLLDTVLINDPGFPEEFKKIHCQALPDGSPTPAFVELIKNLYRNRQVRAGTQRAAV